MDLTTTEGIKAIEVSAITADNFVETYRNIDAYHDELEKAVYRSRSFYKGKILTELDGAVRGDAGLRKQLLKEVNVGETQSLRFRDVYERSVGIEKLIQSPQKDKKGGIGFSEDEIETLKIYEKALNNRPMVSRAFEDVREFKIYRNNKTGAVDYRLIDEAQMYSDALEFYSKSKIQVNELEDYLSLSVGCAKGKNTDPWLVTAQQVKQYVDDTKKEFQDPKMGIKDVTKIAKYTKEEKEQWSRESRHLSIAGDLDFKDWYMRNKMGFKGLQHVGQPQVMSATDEIREMLPVWNDMRKSLLSMVHPDRATGSDEKFQTITSIDRLFKVFISAEDYAKDREIIPRYGTHVDTVELEDLEVMYEKFMQDEM